MVRSENSIWDFLLYPWETEELWKTSDHGTANGVEACHRRRNTFTFITHNTISNIWTKDFSSYSPAELLLRVRETYNDARRTHIAMMREYSYVHGDLGSLSL